MRFLLVLLTGFSCLLCRQTLAASEPCGSVLELHSCELYAGGCIVSSEATLGGRYMLRAWNFASGSHNGIDLAGLNLAVLQSSLDNLAAPKSQPGSVVVYLPQQATPTQREALLAWLKSSQPELSHSAQFQTRVVPLAFDKNHSSYSLTAGAFVSVKTAPIESCVSGACGEALWYSPRATTSLFTVAVNRSSVVEEPLLQLKWADGGRRTIFLGKFGQSTSTQNLFVSLSDLCGPADRLF